MKRILISAFLLMIASAAPGLAQPAMVDTLVTMETSNFYMALIAGLLLAFCFQYVLTLLSAALGISVVHINSDPHDEDDDDLEQVREPSHLGIKITHTFGIWSVLTGTISLFVATYLAIQLSLSASAMTGLILGLVIWAGFTLIATWLEMKSFSSLLGGLAHVATSGLRRTLGTANHMLGHTREAELGQIAESTVKAIRREFTEVIEDSKIVQRLDNYLQHLKPEPIDYTRVRKEVEKLIGRIQVTDTSRDGDRLLLLSVASGMPHLAPDDLSTISQSFDEVMELRSQQGLSAADKALKGFDKLTPASEEEIRQLRERVSEARGHAIGRSIGAGQMRVNDAETGLVLSGQYPVDVNDPGEMSEAGGPEQLRRAPEKLEENIRESLNSLERPEFNYDLIKRDLKKIMYHPDLAPDILKQRLRSYDRESLAALLGSTGMLSRRDIDKITDQIEYVRDELVSTKEDVELQVKERISATRRRALERAEESRRTVAAAGWWLLATTTCSGFAAGLGGWLAGYF
ncbi:MAG: hypothetical protein ACAI44_38980 [Candidatus Sericytochromatia bacterium]